MENECVIHEMPGCKVVRNVDGTVTKSGRRIKLDEVSSLKLAHQLGLPVPSVHSTGVDRDGNPSITMDFVDGVSVEDAWPSMSTDEKRDFALQLRRILSTARSAKPPDSFIGSCNGGPARDGRLISTYTGGPFKCESDFNSFVLDFPSLLPKALANAFKRRLPTDSRIVLSHGDLNQHNIFIKDGIITGIIDWEYAGWFPEYWDYIKFFQRYADAKDWKDYAELIFPESYEDLLLDYQAIFRWQKT